MADQLAIYFFRDLSCSAQLTLDEREHGDALEGRATLAAANDHFDRGKCPRSGFGIVGLFAANATFLEKLQHDVHVSLFTAELFHEIFQHRVHDAVLLCCYRIDGHVAKKDRIGSNSQIVLDFTENNLLAGPTMLDNAVEPRVLLHGNFGGIIPQFLDKLIGLHELGSSSAPGECPPTPRDLLCWTGNVNLATKTE